MRSHSAVYVDVGYLLASAATRVTGTSLRSGVEVDHAAIRSNLEAIRQRAGTAQVIAVVKGNAYGHGAVAVARTLLGAGVERLAVATVDEAVELRDAGVDAPLLLLWTIGPDEAAIVTRLALEPVVYDDRAIDLLEAAADRDGVRIGVHLKVDTGLGRQGATPDEAVILASRIARSRHLRLAGTMTHLAVPGEDDAYTEVQVLRLARSLDAMRSAGVDPGLVHVSATEASSPVAPRSPMRFAPGSRSTASSRTGPRIGMPGSSPP